MLKINYNDLLRNYNSRLTTKLRGFESTNEYLKLWVPNEDILTSTLNLADSLKEYDQLKFKIFFNKEI